MRSLQDDVSECVGEAPREFCPRDPRRFEPPATAAARIESRSRRSAAALESMY